MKKTRGSTLASNQFVTQLAKQFDEYTLVSIRDSVLASISTHIRFSENVYTNEKIKKIAVSDCVYLAVMQGVDDALKNSSVDYKLKTTQPKGGVYPVINLPSFNIIPRRTNTLEAYRQAKYMKEFAIQNKNYEPQTLDLFDDLSEEKPFDEDKVFMLLDVYVDENQKVHFTFILPSSDLTNIHLKIPYDEVLDAYRNLEDDYEEPAAVTPILKATLNDLDKQKLGQ